jgi:ATPase subunit of ABC transporter with duplicated ATPase domains
VTGKDAQAGRLKRQMDGRQRQARQRRDGIRVRKQYQLGIWLPGSLSRRNVLFRIPAGSIRLDSRRRLSFPDLEMQPRDRVALTGPNGAGKSTLVRHIVHSLNLPAERVTCMAQEIDRRRAAEIMGRARALPKAELGHVMTVVSRLGSRPERLLASEDLSPGEVRKLLLALGMARRPHLIIMDEPTNHLDLPSIECLEEALADCPCGLLLVSHDRRFLTRLARTRWHIERPKGQAPRSHLILTVANADGGAD